MTSIKENEYWYKVLAVLMHRLKVTEITLTMDDIKQASGTAIVSKLGADTCTLLSMPIPIAQAMATEWEKAGGIVESSFGKQA